ncbi:MAG: endonuclease/exonuclease/phosphatase family protein [Azoarcus sp.]|jgi:endonuclease/exonuclease/phosphatase (EEP) superfamily protein YafD|nr:endonuclease/exonuclease/phosphatase family protein [Azoarcus sp.]
MTKNNNLPLQRKLSRYVARHAHDRIFALAALALLGWTGSWHWIPELFSHFFFQYAALCALLVPFVLYSRAGFWRWAALAVTILIWGMLLPFWRPAGVADPKPRSRLTLLQFNAAQNTAPLAHWLVSQRTAADVVLVLEADPSFAATHAALAGEYPHHIESLMDGPFGIALLSRHPLVDARILEVIGPEFPAIEASVVLPGGALRLVGIHPPPPIGKTLAALRNRFMEKLPAYLDAGTPTVVFGDFNATSWSPHLRAFMRATGLEDAQRGQGIVTTWPAFAARHSSMFGLPIDMTLVSPALFVEECRAGPFLKSDHLPVLTRIAY